MAKTAKATAQEQQAAQNQQPNAPQDTSKKQAQAVEFPDAPETEPQTSSGKFDILLDMDVPVTAIIGQAEIPVRRLLQLCPGSVLKLTKPVEAPVDLYIKDSKFAEADVVVVDNQFALRITQITGAGPTCDTKEQQGKES